LGCTVEQAWPDYPIERIFPTWRKLRAWQAGTQLKDFYNDPAKRALMKPEAQFEVESGQKLSAFEVYDASATRTAWYQAVRTFFEKYDYFILPAGLAKVNRRQDHGHLPPLDGGDDPGHDGNLSGDRGPGWIQRARSAHGIADHGAKPWRARAAPARSRVR
jgi:hypothetical protein